MFLEEKVDVVILEVGVGGRLDATNCIPKPVVCGVTSLGFDHVELLGHTLPVSLQSKSFDRPAAEVLNRLFLAVTVEQESAVIYQELEQGDTAFAKHSIC